MAQKKTKKQENGTSMGSTKKMEFLKTTRSEVDESYKESSSALYQAYRNYSLDCNEYIRSTSDFYFALEKAGFERLTLNRKRYFKGLKIHEDSGAEEDFLQ